MVVDTESTVIRPVIDDHPGPEDDVASGVITAHGRTITVPRRTVRLHTVVNRRVTVRLEILPEKSREEKVVTEGAGEQKIGREILEQLTTELSRHQGALEGLHIL